MEQGPDPAGPCRVRNLDLIPDDAPGRFSTGVQVGGCDLNYLLQPHSVVPCRIIGNMGCRARQAYEVGIIIPFVGRGSSERLSELPKVTPLWRREAGGAPTLASG